MLSGCVDFVLTPAEIAHELANIGRHPYLTSIGAYGKPPELFPGFVAELQKIFILLHGAYGMDFSLYKDATIKRRITRRMAAQTREAEGLSSAAPRKTGRGRPPLS